jgi:tetratricopeptide (TPR) repeat protein
MSYLLNGARVKNQNFRTVNRWSSMLMAIAGGVCLSVPSWGGASAPTPSHHAVASCSPEKKIEDFQLELLETGYRSASAIPVQPLIKDRSKTQEAVVTSCLELGQLDLASRFTEGIENWRQGFCLANLAIAFGRKGCREKSEAWLDLAEKAAETAEDWRRDRILAKVAEGRALLDQEELALDTLGRMEGDTEGQVAAVEASLETDSDFNDKMALVEGLLASSNFDSQRGGIETSLELYKSHYPDPLLRARVETAIRQVLPPMPVLIRIETLFSLSQAAFEHGDMGKAIEVADETKDLVDSHNWPLEHRLPLVARITKLFHQAGETKLAMQELDSAVAYYRRDADTIVDMWRAGAVRPLAEAAFTTGDQAKALELYKLALEAGVENPNSRPRAVDLSETCCSLAKLGLDPGERLWARIREIEQSLGNPW